MPSCGRQYLKQDKKPRNHEKADGFDCTQIKLFV